MKKPLRRAIGMASIKDDTILLLFKRDVWILPGGKPIGDETDLICLAREIGEELPKANVQIGSMYGNFEGKTSHGGDMLCATVFLGIIDGDITPAAEISKAEYFRKEQLPTIPVSEITQKIILGLIDTHHF